MVHTLKYKLANFPSVRKAEFKWALLVNRASVMVPINIYTMKELVVLFSSTPPASVRGGTLPNIQQH